MLKLSKVNPEIIDKWLHSTIEDGQIINVLINMSWRHCLSFTSEDFKSIGSSVTNIYRIKDALNEYFNERDYPFETIYKPFRAYIKQTKRPYCPLHNKIFKTEIDLKEHIECLKHNFISKTEREIHSDKIIEDEDQATKEKQRKKIEEERKARRDY